MPATVPPATPVRSMDGARALAEGVALAGHGSQVGPAVDRILRFLNALPYPALRTRGEGVLDVLHLIGTTRAAWATDWLARHADGSDARDYWAELCELSLLDIAA